MPSAYATKLAEGFSAKVLEEIYARSLTDFVVNRDYEGEINQYGSKLNILSLGKLSEKDFTGANLTADDLTEVNATLEITKKKSFYWKEKTLDKWLSYIKNPKGTILEQTGNERMKNMDLFVFGFFGDVAAGNRVGADYTTGTVAVDASGNVTGTGTTFTSAMVGRGFKATGHTKWYRVKTYTSGTAIVIENDSDDEVSAYDGGVIAGGTAYTIEATSPVTLTTANVRAQIGKVKIKMDQAEVPDEDRWLVVPTEVEDLITQGGNIQLAVPAAYEDLVKRGFLTELLGFKLFKSVRLSGDNTNGYRILAGHRNWITFAEKILEAKMEEDLIGNFGSAYKDLFVYGAKVPDPRRKFAVEMFAKV